MVIPLHCRKRKRYVFA